MKTIKSLRNALRCRNAWLWAALVAASSACTTVVQAQETEPASTSRLAGVALAAGIGLGTGVAAGFPFSGGRPKKSCAGQAAASNPTHVNAIRFFMTSEPSSPVASCVNHRPSGSLYAQRAYFGNAFAFSISEMNSAR